MNFDIKFSRETDGRWIAEVDGYPGALAYGATREQARAFAAAIALAMMADDIEAGVPPEDFGLGFTETDA